MRGHEEYKYRFWRGESVCDEGEWHDKRIYFHIHLPKYLSNFAATLEGFFSSCSQTRTTFHPSFPNSRETYLSLFIFPSSFLFQNSRLFFGMFECLGQPCQKHPSTKSAIFYFGKTKSGFPSKGWFRRQPDIWKTRKIPIINNSVSLFPFPGIRDITSERFSFA